MRPILDCVSSFQKSFHDRIKTNAPRVRGIAPAGLMFLAITSVGWGFNWPVTKYLLGELPPLTLRGVTGVVGALLLAALALSRRARACRVPRGQWPRLVLAAILNVTCWMVLMGLALLWLPASEAALIAYTMPVWASMLAWPVLGERPNRAADDLAGDGVRGPCLASWAATGLTASVAKLPGIIDGARRRRRLCARHRAGEEAADQPAAAHGRRLADRHRLLSGRHRRPCVRDADIAKGIQPRLDRCCSIPP